MTANPTSLPFRLIVVTDRRLMGEDPVEAVLSLWRAAGCPGWALQWREKDRTPRENYRDLLTLRTELDRTSGAITRPPLLVNDRLDLALALDLHVHLTEQSLPTRVVRSLLPRLRWVGRSVHSIHAARLAEEEEADYLVAGPVFDTPSKRAYGPPLGLDTLRAITRSVRIPVFAVGGIDPTRARDCLSAGAHGIAVVRAIWEAVVPREALRALMDRIEASPSKFVEG